MLPLSTLVSSTRVLHFYIRRCREDTAFSTHQVSGCLFLSRRRQTSSPLSTLVDSSNLSCTFSIQRIVCGRQYVCRPRSVLPEENPFPSLDSWSQQPSCHRTETVSDLLVLFALCRLFVLFLPLPRLVPLSRLFVVRFLLFPCAFGGMLRPERMSRGVLRSSFFPSVPPSFAVSLVEVTKIVMARSRRRVAASIRPTLFTSRRSASSAGPSPPSSP